MKTPPAGQFLIVNASSQRKGKASSANAGRPATMPGFGVVEHGAGGVPVTRSVAPDEAERLLRLASGRRLFASDAEMAGWFGVDRSRITRWRAGAPMDAENLELLRRLDAVVASLDGFYEPEVIPRWLRGINAFLGNRQPLFVLRHGLLSDVIRAIEAEKSGAFA
jgi:hypothetical protein